MGNSITWPAVATVAIVAAMITALALTGHANTITIATGALGSVALAIAHAFIARTERAKVTRKLEEIVSTYERARGKRTSEQADESVSSEAEKKAVPLP